MAPTSADFTTGPLADHGVTVSRTPITKTNDNVTGDKILSEGTPVNISVVFANPDIIYDLLESGETKNTSVNMYVEGTVTINKEDKITWNNLNFRVANIDPRYFNGNLIFKRIQLFLI